MPSGFKSFSMVVFCIALSGLIFLILYFFEFISVSNSSIPLIRILLVVSGLGTVSSFLPSTNLSTLILNIIKLATYAPSGVAALVALIVPS